MTPPPFRQEKQPATHEIAEVAPGVVRLQLPIALPGLGHVNCYLLEDERGVALVDPGLPGEESWGFLTGRLAAAGIPLRRVHTVVITHSHPDHFGGAPRLADEAGADIVTHRRFRLWWEPVPDAEDPETDPAPRRVMGPWDRPTPWGSDPYRPHMEGRSPEELRERMHRDMRAPRPTRRVEEADVLALGRREWVALHTPGHTPDHLCLFSAEAGVLLSGDHVLPTITPHISGIGNTEDPLAEYMASLDRIERLSGVHHVLPAHGEPFTDVHTRVAAIKEHHHERLTSIREAALALGRPAPVRDYMERLFSPRAWGSMAESETYAHLEHLRLAGQAESFWTDGLLYFAITAS